MANILGLPFDPWVKEQIEIRQKSLGKVNIPTNDYQHYTTKTPFLRLASSVNLIDLESDSVLKKILKNSNLSKSEILGNSLAKKCILQAGVVEATDKSFNGLKYGLNNGSPLSGVYGWGGIEERGYVPMPGITNADVTYYNNGALSKTTINIRCYSISQFQLIDALYLRPGYTLLLEFGWSQYLNNDGNLVNFPEFYTEPLSSFLRGNVDQYELYKKIEDEKYTHRGNYEAIFGKITNFNWQFNPDGSYDCQVVLTAVGDVIESLKLNIVTPKSNNNPKSQENGESSENKDNPKPIDPLWDNATSTVINKELINIFFQSMSGGDPLSPLQLTDYTVDPYRDNKLSNISTTKTFEKSLLSIKGVEEDVLDVSVNYIKYGAFLAWLQSNILLYNKEKPLLSFDINFDDLKNDDNYILTIPGQISTDPRVCLIPYTNFNIQLNDQPIGFQESDINKILKDSGFNDANNPYGGRVANIFINIRCIAEILSTLPINDDGDIVVLDFLKELNKRIINATGNINKYDFNLDQSGLKLVFREDIPQRLNTPQSKDSDYAKFNIFGVQKDNIGGSFIRNINLTADLSNDFATMISIGAQSNSNQVNANATSFSNYNAGLEDRIIPTRLSSEDSSTPPSTQEEKEALKINQLNELIQAQQTQFEKIYGNPKSFENETIISFKENTNSSINKALGILTDHQSKTQQLNSPFFLPFNLQLEMDGLSGMKLYEKFRITENVLPPSYEDDSVDIIIKGINHSIDTSAWITKLDTLSTPRGKLSPLEKAPAIAVVYEPPLVSAPKERTPLSIGPNLTGGLIEEKNALEEAYIHVFNKFPENGEYCAQWTFNIAYNYMRRLREEPLDPNKQRSDGAANERKYWSKILALKGGEFYRKGGTLGNQLKDKLIPYRVKNPNSGQAYKTEGLTTEELKKELLNNENWGPGDIVVYYANDAYAEYTGKAQNPHKFGHTQIYVGDINSSGWASSKKLNYGSGFVYGNYPLYNNWDLIVFRGPQAANKLTYSSVIGQQTID